MVDEQLTDQQDDRMGRAVIVGGSVGGSLAAAALASHFREIVLLDKDSLPDEPRQRKGVPQGYQYHALLGGGRENMDKVLPGFKEELVKQGAAIVGVTSEIVMRMRCGFMPRFESDVITAMATRPLIEYCIRKKARELPNLEYRTGQEVYGYTHSEGRVTGVQVRNLESGEESVVTADLVVDTSGRSAQGKDWLEAIGYPRPSELTVNARWGYASALVRIPEGWDPGFRALHCQPLGEGFPENGPATRGCSMWEQEGERVWIFTAQGAAGDYPPRDLEGLKTFVASIGVPEASDALEHFEFITPIQIWRDTMSRKRDYADLDRRPENLLLMGDSVASMNPVYGQGMTVTALEAVALSESIAVHRTEHGNNLTGFAEEFQHRVSEPVEYCWSTSTAQDFAVPGVEVKRDGVDEEPPTAEMAFTDRLMVFVSRDPELYVKWLRTAHLLEDPDWIESEEIVSAIKANWDELGEKVSSLGRELATSG